MAEEYFSLLKNKEIIEILDGDIQYQDYEFKDGTSIKVGMPYLSGPELCGLSKIFGLDATYGGLSRWQYLDNLLEYCIKYGKCSDLLTFMFSRKQFLKKLKGHGKDEITEAHELIVKTVIDNINGLLLFSEKELIFNGNNYVIRQIGTNIEVSVPNIKKIDRDYIKSISSRAMRDIEQNEYDSAITKSRTLLEEVFCYVIEKKNIKPLDDGNIEKLYGQVKKNYNMHIDSNADKRIKKLLSGLNSIVSSIAEMRNKDSDAHGVGMNRIRIEEHHARLFVNASMMMADFILSVQQKNS